MKKSPWQLKNITKNYNSSPKMNSAIPRSHNLLTLYAQCHKAKLAGESEGEGRERGRTWVRSKNKDYWYRAHRETNK